MKKSTPLRPPYDIDLIVNRMELVPGPPRRTDFADIANRYRRLVCREMVQTILMSKTKTSMYVNQTRLRQEIPERYTDETGKKQYWLYWLNQNYPIYTTVRKGHNFSQGKRNGTLTEIMPYMEFTAVDYSLTGSELYDACCLPYSNQTPDIIPVDVYNLTNYIHDANNRLSQLDLHDTGKREYIKKLFRNITYAYNIIALAEYTQSKHSLTEPAVLQYPVKSRYGRTYYQGWLGFTHLPTEVREAALGQCIKYDINASVYAFYLKCAEDFAGRDCITNSIIKEYLVNKTAIRKRLARLISHTGQPLHVRLDWIKEAMTAIGFGAGVGNSWWNTDKGCYESSGLKGIIRNKEDYAAFMSDRWVRYFIDEVKTLTAEIVKQFEADHIEAVAEFKTETKRNWHKKFLAYLYQRYETQVIKTVLSVSTDRENVLLNMHDGFYTRKPIRWTTANETLSTINPYMRFHREDVTRYTDVIAKQRAEEHRRWIELEEANARMYRSKWILDTETASVDINIQRTAFNIITQFYNSAGSPQQRDEARRIIQQDAELSKFYDKWLLEYAFKTVNTRELAES